MRKGKPLRCSSWMRTDPWLAKHADHELAAVPNPRSPRFASSVGVRGTASDSSQRLLRCASKETEALLALVQKAQRDTVTASSAAIREAYLEWLRRTCESVELLGLDLKETQNVRLGQVYVPAVTAPKVENDKRDSACPIGSRATPRPAAAPPWRGIALRSRSPRRWQFHLLPLAGVGGRRRFPATTPCGNAGRIRGTTPGSLARSFSAALPAARVGRATAVPGGQRSLDSRRTRRFPCLLAGGSQARRADTGGLAGGTGPAAAAC